MPIMNKILHFLLLLSLCFTPFRHLSAAPISLTITDNISFGLLIIGEPLAVEADEKVEVQVTGDANSEYSIQFAPIELTGPGGDKLTVILSHNAGTPPMLDGDGFDSFFITATIPEGQLIGKASGDYTGTAEVTVIYP
jgi:hypothetical protein